MTNDGEQVFRIGTSKARIGPGPLNPTLDEASSRGHDKAPSAQMEGGGAMRFEDIAHAAQGIHAAVQASGVHVHDSVLGANQILNTLCKTGVISSGLVKQLNESVGLYRDFADAEFFSYRWARFGLPLFRLTHGLTAALLLTDCKGLRGSDLALPFPAFVVALPTSPRPFLWVTDSDDPGVEHSVSHVLFQNMRAYMPGEDDALSALVERARESVKDGAFTLKQREEINEEFDRGSTTLTSLRLFSPGTRMMTSLRCHWPTGDDSVEEWCKAAFDVPFDGDAFSAELSKTDKLSEAAALRLIANFLVYLQTAHGSTARAHPTASRVYAGTKAHTSSKTPVTTWVIGSEIKLHGAMQEAARQYVSRGRRPKEWRVTQRFTVRGHWRLQAYGIKHSLRRRQWIAPFWKGPQDTKEAITRVYRAGRK